MPADDAARALLALGPSVVLLTRGGDGALALTRAGDLAVAAPPVSVVDTIGAGDAFSGGWLAWWSERGLGRDDLADRRRGHGGDTLRRAASRRGRASARARRRRCARRSG